MPLITAIIGILIGSTAITALTGLIEVSETAPILAVMLGLAVGIDYSLFILSRHRQNIGDGMEPREAAARAAATAGSAVVFAGATVIIALVGLAVLNIPFLTVMGLAAAGTVAIAVAIALTLTPALLGFAGGRVARVNRVLGYRPKRRAEGEDKLSVKYAGFVTRHPVPVLLAGVAVLVAIAIPALDLKLGLPDDGSKTDGHDGAPGLRPADRGLRPRLQRSADGRRRRSRATKEEQAQVARRSPRASPASPAWPRSARRARTRPAISPSSR